MTFDAQLKSVHRLKLQAQVLRTCISFRCEGYLI